MDREDGVIINNNIGERMRQKGLMVDELSDDQKRDRLGWIESQMQHSNGRIVVDLDVRPSSNEAGRWGMSVDWVDREMMEGVVQDDGHGFSNETKDLYRTAIDNGFQGIGLIHIYSRRYHPDRPGYEPVLIGYSHIGVKQLDDGSRVVEAPLKPFSDYYFANEQAAKEMGLDDKSVISILRSPGFISGNYALQVAEQYKHLGVAKFLEQVGSMLGSKVFGATERRFTTDATDNGQGSYYVNMSGASPKQVNNLGQPEKMVPVKTISGDAKTCDFRPFIH